MMGGYALWMTVVLICPAVSSATGSFSPAIQDVCNRYQGQIMAPALVLLCHYQLEPPRFSSDNSLSYSQPNGTSNGGATHFSNPNYYYAYNNVDSLDDENYLSNGNGLSGSVGGVNFQPRAPVTDLFDYSSKGKTLRGAQSGTEFILTGSRTSQCRAIGELHAYWEDGGVCVRLLMPDDRCQFPGGVEGHFILERTSQTAVCELVYRCPLGQLVWELDGRCHQMYEVCPVGQRLYRSLTGKGECDCDYGFIYWAQTERCYRLYSQGPCQVNYYLNMGPNSRPICRPNLCPTGYIPWENGCASLGGPCEQNQRSTLRINPMTLTLECMCGDLEFRVIGDATCHTVYTQGPCATGEYTLYDPVTRSARCQRNVCEDGFLLWEGRCHRLYEKCGDQPSSLVVNTRTLELQCVYAVQRPSIIQVPGYECPPLSARDLRGDCRERLRLDANDDCLPGYRLDLSTGRCSRRRALRQCPPGYGRDVFSQRCAKLQLKGSL